MKIVRIRKIPIQKRPLTQLLAFYIFLMPFLLATLQEFLGFPSVVKYTIDVAWAVLLGLTLMKQKITFERKMLPLVCLIVGFFLYTLLLYCFHYQSAAYYLWGLRNNFRFYIAFFAFAACFDEEDIESCFRIMNFLFWVNAAVSFVQFFFLGFRQDYLGGIFGVEKGCNAYSIIFFSIVLTHSILSMMHGKENVVLCMLRCTVALILSAWAELKAFYLIFVVILVLSSIFTGFSWKKCALFIISGFLFSVVGTILTELFGESSNLSIERIFELIFSSNYASATDMGRMTAIPIISRRFLTSIPDRLFGMGMGNCDTSAFAVCNTPFYQAYSHLHYTWFSSAFLFLETGYVGLILFLSFFVICLICALRQLRAGNSNQLYCNIAVIMSVICIVLTFYNSSLRMEAGYLAYFSLALPFEKNENRSSY